MGALTCRSATAAEWLERWSLTLHRDLPFESMPEVPRDIVDADDRLEGARITPAIKGVAPRQVP